MGISASRNKISIEGVEVESLTQSSGRKKQTIILTSRTTAFSEQLSSGVSLENNNRTAKRLETNDTSQQPCCYFDRYIETNERISFLVKRSKTASSTLINVRLGSLTDPIECNVEKDVVLLTLFFSENGMIYQIDSEKQRKLRASVPKNSYFGLQFLEHTITVECVLPVTAEIASEILDLGPSGIKNFIRHLENNTEIVHHARGMIIGWAGAGKTTILKKLLGKNPKKKIKRSTRGVSVHTAIFKLSKDEWIVNKNKDVQFIQIPLSGFTPNIQRDQSSASMIGFHDLHTGFGDIYRFSDTTFPSHISEYTNSDHQIPEIYVLSAIERVNASNTFDEKYVSFMDFAGQTAYYASHQIYLNCRAFHLLVIDMTKNLTDIANDEACTEADSCYRNMTYLDFVLFWLRSVHSYGDSKAPVVLVGTHAEGKTDQEKSSFFDNLRMNITEREPCLLGHINTIREFSFGLDDDLSPLKKCVSELIKDQKHWGERRPSVWTLFENIFISKRDACKILHLSELQKIMNILPRGLQFASDGKLYEMLQFYHDNGRILYFNQESLKEFIILDVQWFVNAFKNIITAKCHANEDLRNMVGNWEKFNKTGQLESKVLMAIWGKCDETIIQHKEEIVYCMERLGLLSKTTDELLFVPCMNKIPFPAEKFAKSYIPSSTLCIVFDFLPPVVFYSVIARALTLHWKVLDDGEKKCIYQNATIFESESHIFLIGIAGSAIHIQFLSLKDMDSARNDKMVEIKGKVLEILDDVIRTFHTNITYRFGYKCTISGFENAKHIPTIFEDIFMTGSNLIQCPKCPIDKKHVIDKFEIKAVWEKDQGKVIVKPAASGLGKKKDNYKDIVERIMVDGTQTYRMAFDRIIPPAELPQHLVDNEQKLKSRLSAIFKDSIKLLYPENKNKTVMSSDFDIPLMYKLLRNTTNIPKPSRDWGKKPELEHITESDDLERLRIHRNTYAHPGSKELENEVFEMVWFDISKAIERLSKGRLT